MKRIIVLLVVILCFGVTSADIDILFRLDNKSQSIASIKVNSIDTTLDADTILAIDTIYDTTLVKDVWMEDEPLMELGTIQWVKLYPRKHSLLGSMEKYKQGRPSSYLGVRVIGKDFSVDSKESYKYKKLGANFINSVKAMLNAKTITLNKDGFVEISPEQLATYLDTVTYKVIR